MFRTICVIDVSCVILSFDHGDGGGDSGGDGGGDGGGGESVWSQHVTMVHTHAAVLLPGPGYVEIESENTVNRFLPATIIIIIRTLPSHSSSSSRNFLLFK